MTHPTPYLRYPHLHGDLITFVAADDVWLAPADGGRAWRLTSGSVPVRSPRISPDGTHVAFISSQDGHQEVYAASIESGHVRRLTYWGSSKAAILGWAADGRLLVATHAVEAVAREQVVHAVSLEGGTERLSYGSAAGLDIHPHGAVALATPPTRPAGHWKRYRGGVAGQLWIDTHGSGQWQQLLPQEAAGLLDPMWVGDALAFSSDLAATFPENTQEQANLWVFDPAQLTNGAVSEAQPRQLTFQNADQGYVRDATTDGARITWHSRGQIYILDSLDAEPRCLDVTLPGSGTQPLPLKPTQNLDAVVPDYSGDASVVSWRGKTFHLTHREGPARALVADSGIRTRHPVPLGQTSRIALITDAEGEDALEVHTLDDSAAGAQRLLHGELGRVLHLASDPTGEQLAVITLDGRVLVITLSHADASIDADTREVHHSEHGEVLTPSFSPDGRYLLFSAPTGVESQVHQLMIADLTTTEPAGPLTSGIFHDFSPAFTPDGKHVAFLSNRTLDPHYDAVEFNLSFHGSTRPWLLPLSASQPAPLGPSAEGWPVASSAEESDADSDANSDTVPQSPDLDAVDAEQRIIAFPVPSATYRTLRAVDGGLLWVQVAKDTGELGTRRAGVPGEKTPDKLVRWDLKERKASTIVEKLDSYRVSGNGKRLIVRHKTTVTVVPSAKKVQEKDSEHITVDLTRLRFTVDRTAEWTHMFDETCRLMTHEYWREDFDGIDWDAVTQRWRPVVQRVRTHDDLVDLLWETVGELNTSHAYVMPTPNGPGADRRLGLLGADLEPATNGEAPGWRIARILPTESSEPEARSPLRAAGVDAQEGDIITAVDGQPVDPVFGPNALLAGAARKPVELTLRRSGAAEKDSGRRAVVVPLASEEDLRYQDWVRSRREYVREVSQGRLGYVHVPDMTSTGWAQLHRDLRLAAACEGIIVDVRYNRGGHTSQMVLQRLTKQLVAWTSVRGQTSMRAYPLDAPRGPVVLVANRWSGSDGDIVNAAAQAMKLGPVIGERTWGGVIGIDGRHRLIDGTSVTQPKYAFWIQGYGWGVENYGVEPDIEVIHDPGQWFAEEDPQLDRAVEEAFAHLDRTPAATPPPMDPPKNR